MNQLPSTPDYCSYTVIQEVAFRVVWLKIYDWWEFHFFPFNLWGIWGKGRKTRIQASGKNVFCPILLPFFLIFYSDKLVLDWIKHLHSLLSGNAASEG